MRVLPFLESERVRLGHLPADFLHVVQASVRVFVLPKLTPLLIFPAGMRLYRDSLRSAA